MSWQELKELGQDYGSSLTFARTYFNGGNNVGMLEFSEEDDANMVVKELNNRKVQGSKGKLKAYHGAGPGRD